MRLNTIFTGVGSHIPERVISNAYFLNYAFHDKRGRRIEKESATIVKKLEDISGIRERKYIHPDHDTAEMASRAGKKALSKAQLDPEQLDGIIVAHNFGNILPGTHYGQAIPNLAATVKGRMQISRGRCFAYDLLFGCPGWVEGVIAAHQYIQNRAARHILVIGVELISRLLDPHDMDSMLFGDGAGAVVISGVEEDEHRGVLGHMTYSHCGEELDYLKMGLSNKKNGISYLSPKMDGRMVYRYAVTYMPTLITETLEECGIEPSAIDKFLFHQANEKMIKSIAAKIYEAHNLSGEIDEKVPFMVQEIGNSSVATIPTMLDRMVSGLLPGHSIDRGDTIIMASVGAGMHCNDLIYRL